MKKTLGLTMIVMILIFGISIERDTTVVVNRNPYDKYINYNMCVNPDNLKMTTSMDIREKDLLNNLFEGLVKEDEDGKIIGALAKEISIEDDGLMYKFKIREDAYYSSGEKVDAKEFVDFFRSFLDDEENVYRTDLDFIYGVKDYREGTIDFSQVAIFADENDEVLTIRLNSPCPYFLKILAHPVYTLRDYNKVDNYKAKHKNIRYTGPFIVKNAFKNEIIMGKNERYYETEVIVEDEIRISFIEIKEDSLTIFEDIENKSNNKIDLMMDIPINEIDRLKKQKLIKEFLGNEILTLTFNIGKNELASDIEFRRAIRYVLSKEMYKYSMLDEVLIPTYSAILNKEQSVEVFKPTISKDTTSVFNRLKEDDVKIKVIYEDENIQRRVAKEICENLTKETEIEFMPIEYSDSELNEVLNNVEYHININSFRSKYDSNFEYFEERINQGGDEYKNIINKNYYTSEEEAIKGFNQCEKILEKTILEFPLYRVNSIVCFKRDLVGFYVNSTGNINLRSIKRVG